MQFILAREAISYLNVRCSYSGMTRVVNEASHAGIEGGLVQSRELGARVIFVNV